MKYNCPRCKKEFSLSSKLAGKQLRIRCTSCGTVFRMRLAPGPSAGQESQPTAAPKPAVPAEPQHKYFAVIGGKRLGPMPYAALKRLIAEEKIQAKTLLWRKGLAEWLPAADLEDVQSLFPKKAPPPPPLPPKLPKAAPPSLAAKAAQESPDDLVRKAAEEAARSLEQQDVAPTAAEVKGKVTGDILDQVRPVQKDEEPTDDEVDLDEVDNQFFSAGEMTGEAAVPSRDIGAIELSDGPMFPVEMEPQLDAKDAKASLKDFSVMVTLSRKSRAKGVFALVGLGVVAVATIVLIFTFGDPLGWKDPAKQEVEFKQEGHKGLLAEKAKEQAEQQAVKEKEEPVPAPEEKQGEDPEELIKKMEQKEWKVSLDEEEMAVDREALGEKLGNGKKPVTGSSGQKASNGSSRPRTGKNGSENGDEISLEEFATSHALSKKETGSAIKAATGGAKTTDQTVGKGMDSAMGNLLGGNKLQERKIVANVKERAGDGSALKALVARRVSKKVGGERGRIKSCMDRLSGSYSGPGGQLKAALHFTDTGTVSRVSIKGGGPDLEKCFADIFTGWSIPTINRKIKIPIAVRFE